MSMAGLDVKKLLAGEIMHSPLITASPDDDMQAVLEKMATSHISSVVIKKPNTKLAYIITTGDIIRWLAKHQESIANLNAKKLMHGPVDALNHMDPIDKVINYMFIRGLKRVVIENDRHEKIGIISIRDILAWNVDVLQRGNPFLLLTVRKDSGVVISEYRFPTLQDFSIMSVDLLGSSLTAITHMTNELIKASGDLKVVRKENYVFMIESGKVLKAILVADKESIELRKRLKEFIANVEEVNRDLLEQIKPPNVIPGDQFKIQEVVDQCFGYIRPPSP